MYYSCAHIDMSCVRFSTILPLVFALVSLCTCFKSYQERIPNGDSIPVPCKPGQTWKGVGHLLVDGGSALNPFGRDFKDNGKRWTAELCRLDSDGDGMTNGQELGDPDCVWQPGDTPTRQTELSHPGVCDIWSSPECFLKDVSSSRYENQEAWMKDVCTTSGLDCPAINQPDVQKRNYTLNRLPVPSRETTYMCQVFEFPEGDFHMVATEPIIDNSGVLHHMVLFGCDDEQEMTGTGFECGMVPSRHCRQFLSVWSLGVPGSCYHQNSGISIGAMGYKKFALQYHWFNPQMESGLSDSSGMTIYFTEKKRQYEVAIMITGSTFFSLPAGRERIPVESQCTETCTRGAMRNGPIYISSAWNHMHYLGVEMSIEIRRNGRHVKHLTDQKSYDYDNPQMVSYDPPYELQPGDEIRTQCRYNTITSNRTVYFGDQTTDEMCFGFITFYPKENFPPRLGYCLSKLGVIRCDPATYSSCPDMFNMYGGWKVASQPFFRDIVASCNNSSSPSFLPTSCSEECAETIVRHIKTDGCLQGDIFQILVENIFLYSDEGRLFRAILGYCIGEVKELLHSRPPALNATSEPNSLNTVLPALNTTSEPNSFNGAGLMAVTEKTPTLVFTALLFTLIHIWIKERHI